MHECMRHLRWELVDSEIPRYRWLGQHAAQAAVDVLKQYRPGLSERKFQALLAERLIEQGILPSVYLTAVDSRVLKYRHAWCPGLGCSSTHTTFVPVDLQRPLRVQRPTSWGYGIDPCSRGLVLSHSTRTDLVPPAKPSQFSVPISTRALLGIK